MLSIKKLIAKILTWILATISELTVTNPTISITTRVGTLNGAYAYKCGKIVQLMLVVSRSGSTAAGSSIYEGTINTDGLKSITLASSAHYYGGRSLSGHVNGDDIVIRNSTTSAVSNVSNLYIGFTYIVA